MNAEDALGCNYKGRLAAARKRVTEFLAQRREARGLHPDIIHGYNHAELLISDIDTLIAGTAPRPVDEAVDYEWLRALAAEAIRDVTRVAPSSGSPVPYKEHHEPS